MAEGSPISTAVVGIDDSEHSKAAFEWACQTVSSNGTVHALRGERGHSSDQRVQHLRNGIESLDTMATVTISEIDLGDAGSVGEMLLRRADQSDADIVVVGVHEQRRHTPRRLGATVSELLRHTTRPLAIVGDRPARDSPTGETPATVVVGVGAGDASRASLRWAAAYAADNGFGLELVRALPNHPVFSADGIFDLMAYFIDRDMARDWAMDDIESLADEIVRANDLDIAVNWSAPRGSTGPLLVEASRGAALLVLGLQEDPDATAPADNEVPAWLHHAVVHAPCPVVVVPPRFR